MHLDRFKSPSNAILTIAIIFVLISQLLSGGFVHNNNIEDQNVNQLDVERSIQIIQKNSDQNSDNNENSVNNVPTNDKQIVTISNEGESSDTDQTEGSDKPLIINQFSNDDISPYDSHFTFTSTPDDITYENGSQLSHSLNWTIDNCGGQLIQSYSITQNGSIVDSGDFADGDTISINVNNLVTNTYEYVIEATCETLTFGETISDTAYVYVLPPNAPELNSPSDITYAESDSSKTVTWEAIDDFPNVYNVTKDGTPYITNQEWTNGEIIVDVNDLKGVYEYNITVHDHSGHFSSDIVMVSIEDMTIPDVNGSEDINYNEFTTGNSISWSIGDRYPDTYNITKDGQIFDGRQNILWENGTINLNVDGLNKGTHTFTLSAMDDSGNIGSDQVIVSVYDVTSPDVTSPSDFTISESTSNEKISWTLGDRYPNIYNVTINGSLYVDNTSWINSTLNVEISDYTRGVYNYTIYIYDDSFNVRIDSVIVTIEDQTAPDISSPADQIISETDEGTNITWTNVGDHYPGTYDLFINGSIQLSNQSWINGSITYEFVQDTKSLYNITIVVFDEDENYSVDTVFIEIIDDRDPQITEQPSDATIAESSSGNSLIWNSTDKYPETYDLYQNVSIIKSDTWNDKDQITFSIDHLTKGVYNFTIVIFDKSGNMNASTVIITVQDQIAPLIADSPVSPYIISESSDSSISWTATDNYADTFIIYQNGSDIFNSGWNSDSAVSANLGTLELGVYNYTIVFYDESNNYVINTVIVEVVDTTDPNISSSSGSVTYSAGTTGNTITWIAEDKHPHKYNLYLNGSLNSSGSWDSGIELVFGIDGLEVGTYNWTIYFNDTSGNNIVDTIYLEVVDVPTFTDIPDDMQFTNDTTGNEISWTASDSNPDWFEIYENGTLVKNGTWSSNTPINFNMDDFGIGTYNISIFLNNSAGNYLTDYAFVEISDRPQWKFTATDIEYNEDQTGNYLTWNSTDTSPDNYIIYRNNTAVKTGSWNNSDIIELKVDGLLRGLYNYTIVVYDEQGNKLIDTAFVEVLDTENPDLNSPEDQSIDEGSTGNEIVWTVGDRHPGLYNITLENGSVYVSDTAWVNGSITVDIDGLDKGTYNFTIAVSDDSGNVAFDYVIIHVNDITPPDIDQPDDITYDEFTSGNIINWQVSDEHPGTYNVTFENGTVFGSNIKWDSGTITVNIDGFTKGQYNLTIYLFDESGNTVNDSVLVKVIDNSNPDVTSVSGYDYAEWSTGNSIGWVVGDAHLLRYNITKDGVLINDTFWNSNTTVEINIDGLERGVYEYTLFAYDQDYNVNSSTITVTVYDGTKPDVAGPSDFELGEYQDNRSITWELGDKYPGTFDIQLNGSAYQTYTNVVWNNGSITIDIIFLEKDVYNFTIFVYDDSGNVGKHSILVMVVDNSLPEINSIDTYTYSEGTINHIVNITIGDRYPNEYSILKNGTALQNYDNNVWNSNTTISLNISGLNKEVYNYTIIAIDDSNNKRIHTIMVYVIDTTNPTIDNHSDKIYLEKESKILLWNATDRYSDFYIVYLNNTEVKTDSWENDTSLSVDLGYLQIGLYNLTIKVFDESGNYDYDQVWIDITEKDAPNISLESTPEKYVEGMSNYTLHWNITDKYPDNYVLYINSLSFDEGNWVNGSLLIDIDGLLKNTYNFTIVVFDEEGNWVNDTVYITVFDETAPMIISSPSDFSYKESSSGNTLSWSGEDNYPAKYFIYRNGSLLTSSSWSSNSEITINIDDLSLSYYNFTIVLYDESNNVITDTIIIEIIDTTLPKFEEKPGDVEIYVDEPDVQIIWNVSDLHPDRYMIYQNGSVIQELNWTSNKIIVNIQDYNISSYNITIIIFDTSGNSRSDTVFINVKSLISTQKPSVQITQQVNSGDIDILEGNWRTSNESGISNATIHMLLYHENGSIKEWFDATDTNGDFIVELDYTNIVPGTYYWNIRFSNSHYEDAQITHAKVVVTSKPVRISVEYKDEVIQNSKYDILIFITYEDLTQSNGSLNLQELRSQSGGVPDVTFKLIITMERVDGEQRVLEKLGTTNSTGYSIISLTPEETNTISSISNIQVSIVSNELIEPVNPEVIDENLPTIQFSISNYILVVYFMIISNIIKSILAFVFLITVLMLMINILRKRRQALKEYQQMLTDSELELNALLSLRLIIIQSRDGLPLYQKKIKQVGVETSLIGGLASAVSSFMTEVGRKEYTGFETMERQGLSLTSHKMEFSTLIIISDDHIPQLLYDPFEQFHESVAEQFEDEFKSGSGKAIGDKQILPLFEENEFYIELTRQISLVDNIDEILKENEYIKEYSGIIGAIKDIMVDYVSEGIFVFQLLDELFERNINRDLAAHVILSTYRIGGIVPNYSEPPLIDGEIIEIEDIETGENYTEADAYKIEDVEGSDITPVDQFDEIPDEIEFDIPEVEDEINFDEDDG